MRPAHSLPGIGTSKQEIAPTPRRRGRPKKQAFSGLPSDACFQPTATTDARTCPQSQTVLAMWCANGCEPHFVAGTCWSLSCTACAKKVKARRGNRWLNRAGSKGMYVIGFTVPDDLHHRLTHAHVEEITRGLVKSIKSWAVEVWQTDVGITVYFHPVGKDDTWKPHWHIQVPALGLSAGRTKKLGGACANSLTSGLSLSVKQFVSNPLAHHLGIEPFDGRVYLELLAAGEETDRAAVYHARSFPQWRRHPQVGRLLRQRSFGLLAPACRKTGIERWRMALARVREPTVHHCIDCGCTAHHVERFRPEDWIGDLGYAEVLNWLRSSRSSPPLEQGGGGSRFQDTGHHHIGGVP